MAPTGYLSATGIEKAIAHLAITWPDLCQRLPLPEATSEGRAMSALRLTAPRPPGPGPARPGLLLVAGLHAREVVNPDLLVMLAVRLCSASAAGAGLSLGAKAYSAAQVKRILTGLELYILPCANPDGRAFVLSPDGDAWWRKNRRPTVPPHVGVDLNRNFDFLWPSGIGTSADPADYQVYKGQAPFSEAETRNLRHLLESYPIAAMVDVHSYSELVLWPWGDDEIQGIDPAMNFANPAFDGHRGVIGDGYREFMPDLDRHWFERAGAAMRDAIAAVRGRSYSIQASSSLYPTSGCSNDWAYARHRVDGAARKVWAFAVETGREFQPPYDEARQVMDEASAGLLALGLSLAGPRVRPWKAEKPVRPSAPRRLAEPGPTRKRRRKAVPA